jgi:hypothetical protein
MLPHMKFSTSLSSIGRFSARMTCVNGFFVAFAGRAAPGNDAVMGAIENA